MAANDEIQVRVHGMEFQFQPQPLVIFSNNVAPGSLGSVSRDWTGSTFVSTGVAMEVTFIVSIPSIFIANSEIYQLGGVMLAFSARGATVTSLSIYDGSKPLYSANVGLTGDHTQPTSVVSITVEPVFLDFSSCLSAAITVDFVAVPPGQGSSILFQWLGVNFYSTGRSVSIGPITQPIPHVIPKPGPHPR